MKNLPVWRYEKDLIMNNTQTGFTSVNLSSRSNDYLHMIIIHKYWRQILRISITIYFNQRNIQFRPKSYIQTEFKIMDSILLQKEAFRPIFWDSVHTCAVSSYTQEHRKEPKIEARRRDISEQPDQMSN